MTRTFFTLSLTTLALGCGAEPPELAEIEDRANARAVPCITNGEWLDCLDVCGEATTTMHDYNTCVGVCDAYPECGRVQ